MVRSAGKRWLEWLEGRLQVAEITEDGPGGGWSRIPVGWSRLMEGGTSDPGISDGAARRPLPIGWQTSAADATTDGTETGASPQNNAR